ncbi:MAG: FtsH protease activity modulator HflK [Alphaproteobacteria bacterium]
MPWNKNSGKGGWNQGGGQGPWGGPPPGGGSPGGGGRKGGEQPPDLEQILRRGQERLRKVLPAGAPGGSFVGIAALVIALFWLISGVYQVGPAQNAVVQRFGKFAGITQPGLQWRIPWPVDTYKLLDVKAVQKTPVGFEAEEDARAVADTDQSLMLTSDRNFLKVKFIVQWQISDAKKYAFNVAEPKDVVRTTAQSAMREIIGRGSFDQLQTGQRTQTEEEVKRLLQAALNAYDAGIEVLFINLQAVDPPDKALDAARDVQTAGQERETKRNQAETYQNNVVPKAKGEAQQIIVGAEAYKQKVIADAQGESQRFLSVYDQYKRAPEVTRRRMYLETMEGVLGGTNKVIIDRSAGGVVPYLPLNNLSPRASGQSATANPPAGPGGQSSQGAAP